MKAELILSHGGVIQYPAVQEGIELSLERKGAPGKLSFTAVQDATLNFEEGAPCRLAVDGKVVFYGFVFTKKRGKEGLIRVTAYDQLRYLKNKDTYNFVGVTATEVVQMIAKDFELNTGLLEDTGFKIASMPQDNCTLFDMILDALDATLTATRKLFVLYDDAGRLCLQNVENMKLDLLLDADTAENYDFQSTIDTATYNRIKVVREDSDAGKRSVYIAQDGAHIDAWGVLQLTETVESPENGRAKADGLLALYNEKTRTLTASNVLGRTDVRAGSSIAVRLSLGDLEVSNYMLVETVRHTFNEQQHLMQLKLRGGAFNV